MNIRDTARKLRNEYLIRVCHEPRDSRRVGGGVTYAKPSGRITIVKGGSG